jgi:hypothetical protein
MFEKLGQVAEQMATNVSRRQALGRIGRAALAAAAAIGGMLAFGEVAEAQSAVCGPGSTPSCAGRAVGSVCGPERRGVRPRCRLVGTICQCSAR